MGNTKVSVNNLSNNKELSQIGSAYFFVEYVFLIIFAIDNYFFVPWLVSKIVKLCIKALNKHVFI